eukprot:833824-Alexandrium_andersonii.AAC.1
MVSVWVAGPPSPNTLGLRGTLMRKFALSQADARDESANPKPHEISLSARLRFGVDELSRIDQNPCDQSS